LSYYDGDPFDVSDLVLQSYQIAVIILCVQSLYELADSLVLYLVLA